MRLVLEFFLTAEETKKRIFLGRFDKESATKSSTMFVIEKAELDLATF